MHCMYVTPFLPQRAAYVMNHSTYEAQILQKGGPNIGLAVAKNRTEISAIVQKFWGPLGAPRGPK